MAGTSRDIVVTRAPITHKALLNWAGQQVLKDAETIVDRGLVLESAYEPPHVTGALLWNNRRLTTGMKILNDGNIESQCPCYTNKERGLICAHVIALGLVLVKRQTDPERETKYQAELRRASRLAEFKDSDYVHRLPDGSPGSVASSISVTLQPGWTQVLQQTGKVPVICDAIVDGQRYPVDQVPAGFCLGLHKHDENLLFVLEDIATGPARHQMELPAADLINVFKLYRGRSIPVADGSTIYVNATQLTSRLRIDLDRDTGELVLMVHTEAPFMKEGDIPDYIICGKEGWLLGAGNLWPVESLMPLPYHGIYQEPVIVGRPHVVPFLKVELPMIARFIPCETDLSIELFAIEPDTPKFRLFLRGSPASLSAVLHAVYEGHELVAGKADPQGEFATPVPSDIMAYRVRNVDAERRALEILTETGLRGMRGDDLTPIMGNRLVINFLGGCLPDLRRRGWKIEMEGKVSSWFEEMTFVTPVVNIHQGNDGGNWFDVAFNFEDETGASISQSEIQQALLRGERYIKRGERTLLLDGTAIESMQSVFADCASSDGGNAGHFRMSNVYAAFVKSSLDALDGVDVEDTPDWRKRAAQQNRLERIDVADLPDSVLQRLRPYQRDGVSWLRFLEVNGFSGLLADEMGLGKTIQTLAWIQMARQRDEAKGKPGLIVCPTSIVENWCEEAAKFAPGLKVLPMAGPDRHEHWPLLPQQDLVVTSYALLRRDLDRYREIQFSMAALDEAQHIKNRSTANAVAAKQIKAINRLVLTGTPIENSVSDLWSIMDFLMPGYLGSHETFKHNYEGPLSRGGAEGEQAQWKLRRKLHPFMLRRLKRDVAAELPPKIERIATCELSPDQKLVYGELLRQSQVKVQTMIQTNGFNKSRMEILAVLMRLRQVCCHLGLLNLEGIAPEQPSAKMELFFELLDQALDSGHRVLVFSQFVSMLTLIRKELDSREMKYCYLDGSTKERMKIVHQFNAEKDIPVFLISLKAGGTGLNLTGADMVIHFDPWWNPAVEDQATDRAYRIGQKRTVYSVKLITRDTVEEKVLALQKKKKAVSDATIESDEKMIETFSWDDVRELLEL